MNGGLGPPLLPGDLNGKDEEDLVEVILDGVPGTPMPPWRFELSREEAVWMVHRLWSKTQSGYRPDLRPGFGGVPPQRAMPTILHNS